MNYSLGELVSMIAAAIGSIFWLARLEGKVKKNAEDVTRLELRVDRERSDTREALADLTDVMREQSRDIKILLGRGHQVHWDDKTQPPR